MHRRQFIRRAAAAGALGTLAVGTATAAEPPSRLSHLENVGDDIAELRKYQPSIIASREARQLLVGVYGWYAESSEYPDLRAYYYWFKYPTQQSGLTSLIPFLSGPDAHFGDHEPFVSIVDKNTGEVVRTLKSGYHHFVLELLNSDLELRTQHADVPSHPKLRVVDPWHHFRNGANASFDGVLPDTISGAEFGSWLDKRDPWYTNGVYQKSSTEAVEDPFSLLEGRDTWWADGTWDAWAARNIWIPLGMRGADESDTLRVED